MSDERPRREKTLPPMFIHCDRDDLIILIARMLNCLIELNDQRDNDNNEVALRPDQLTRFHSRTPPAISVFSYLRRLSLYSSLENAVLLTAVYYIDLLTTVFEAFTINSLTVHRFLLTATTVGSKGLCDSFCTNGHYAKVGGIHANELDILEKEFLSRVRYRVLPRDFNIKKCAEETLGSTGAPERRSSIAALESGNTAVSSSDLHGDIDGQEKDVNNVWKRENAGFNILDQYYTRMVKLVGAAVHQDEAEEAITYRIDETIRPTQVGNYIGAATALINPEADTMPEAEFQARMQKLREAIQQHDQQVKLQQRQNLLVQQQQANLQQLNIQQTGSPHPTQARPRVQFAEQPHNQPQALECREAVVPSQSHTQPTRTTNASHLSQTGHRVHPQVEQVLKRSLPQVNNGAMSEEKRHFSASSDTSSSTTSSSGSSKMLSIPASPLKRAIDPDARKSEPSGKRSLNVHQ